LTRIAIIIIIIGKRSFDNSEMSRYCEETRQVSHVAHCCQISIPEIEKLAELLILQIVGKICFANSQKSAQGGGDNLPTELCFDSRFDS
jgi:hypothetical protein